MSKRIVGLIFVVLFCLAGSATASERPVVGACVVMSANILGDKDNEAPKLLDDAVMKKFDVTKYRLESGVTATDFKNYLGKKDMLVSEIPDMIKEIKLATFIGYGVEKNLEYLMVVFCDATTDKFEKKQASGWLGSFGGGYNANNRVLIKTAHLVSRVVFVDVKKQEYIYNVMLNKNVDDHYGFATDVRAIRSVTQEYVKDFDNQIKI
jgi:hypothetical protein